VERARPNPIKFATPAYGHIPPTHAPIISLLGTANAGADLLSILRIIPPNSWANGKALLIRGWYLFTIAGGGLPPFYNVTEFVRSTQGNNTALLTPAAFAPVAGLYGTWIERRWSAWIQLFEYLTWET